MASSDVAGASEHTPLLGRRRESVSSGSSLTLGLSGSELSESSASSSASGVIPVRGLVDEEAPPDPSATSETVSTSIIRIISVLLIGGFISNADFSLVLATHPVIASEFNALDDSSWLVTSFALASAATQPLYGKLSDIYGRRSLLIVSYSLFGLGLLIVGMGRSMSELILGRVISGAGSSGMTVLVSILITDLLPLREVASWRSYVNIVATTGRSIGGPLGGWLADSVGWRWSFLGQVPFTLVAVILVGLTLPPEPSHLKHEARSARSKLARVDFLGALLMTLTILAFLFPLEIGGVKVPWSHPVIPIMLLGGCAFAALFLASQAYLAKEPIFPIELLKHRDVICSMTVMACQSAAQLGMMFAVPLYFQVTARASNSAAGAHLIPAVVGNAVGGILAGIVIKRTGRYKALILLATCASSAAYLLLILRWHGSTNWLESLYIFPGGFGSGIAQSALFISLQAAIEPAHMAVAASGLYLSASVGSIAGMAGVAAVLQEMLRRGLESRLGLLGFVGEAKMEIIEQAISDVHYIDHAPTPAVVGAVVGSYVEALAWTHGLSLMFSLLALVVTMFIRQHRM